MKAIGMPMKKKAKKGTKMTPSQEMAMKKAKKGTMGLVKGVKAFESQTKRRKGSNALITNPKNTKMPKKSAKKASGLA